MNTLLMKTGILLSGLLLAGFGVNSSQNNTVPNTNVDSNVVQPQGSSIMSELEAKNIALNHAGYTDSEVTFVQVKLDYDNGVPEYEVEFYVGNLEYDYEIHGTTGEILEFDQDMETFRPTTGTTTPTTTITETEAKNIALNHAGYTDSEVTFVKVKLDYDDGVAEYEVEFYVGNLEYDYEIHATTGEILGFDQDMETSRPTTGTTTPTTTLTETEAKKIALNHAGYTESQVTFVKVKLDYDDGVAEYEVEFYAGNVEFDYEIHATTGEILGFDQEMESSRPTTGTTTPTTTLSEAEVKNIALNHAGFAESQVSFLKVKMEYEKGIPEYEVEFKAGNMEYDYEIHGNTGEILSVEKDRD